MSRPTLTSPQKLKAAFASLASASAALKNFGEANAYSPPTRGRPEPTPLRWVEEGLGPPIFGKLIQADPPYCLNTDRSAAVSTDTFYSEDMASCPRGVKLILLTVGGVAVLGRYTGDPFYVGWHALPRRKIG